MSATATYLVIGPEPAWAAVRRALPRVLLDRADHALDGVWRAGRQPYDGIFVALDQPDASRALRAIRTLQPHVRIVLLCQPSQEPDARNLLHDLADDYVLLPATADDLRAAVTALPAPPPPTPAAIIPSIPVAAVRDLLQAIDGPLPAILQSVTTHLADLFQTDVVLVEVGEELVRRGVTTGPLVLEATLRSADQYVGRLAVGPRRHGAYPAVAAERLVEFAALVADLLTQHRQMAAWREQARIDDLSGLLARRAFDRAFDELLVRAAIERTRVTLFLLDLDDFKAYNDTHGHAVGDQLIREFAAVLRRCSRDSDLVGRIGGDEFAVVFWDAEKPRVAGSRHPADPLALADRFRLALAEHHFECLGDHAPGTVTISGGLASYPWDGHTRPALMAAADAALLEAKRHGKNRLVIARCGDLTDAPADEAPTAPPPPSSA